MLKNKKKDYIQQSNRRDIISAAGNLAVKQTLSSGSHNDAENIKRYTISDRNHSGYLNFTNKNINTL